MIKNLVNTLNETIIYFQKVPTNWIFLLHCVKSKADSIVWRAVMVLFRKLQSLAIVSSIENYHFSFSISPNYVNIYILFWVISVQKQTQQLFSPWSFSSSSSVLLTSLKQLEDSRPHWQISYCSKSIRAFYQQNPHLHYFAWSMV